MTGICRDFQQAVDPCHTTLQRPPRGLFSYPEVSNGQYPQYGWDFPEENPENSGKTLETLSELFLEFLSRVRLGCTKPYNSRHLKAPEHFQNSPPSSTTGDASFFRSGSREGLSEPVMEFPAVLGVSLKQRGS